MSCNFEQFIPDPFCLNLLFMLVLLKVLSEKANSVDPDQSAPSGALWSGSALFAYAILFAALVYEILGHLPVWCHKLRGMDTLSGEATLSNCLAPFWKKGLPSKKKEFVPLRSNSFLLKKATFQKRLVLQVSKQEVAKSVSRVKMSEIPCVS